jgi:VWFA-related protein
MSVQEAVRWIAVAAAAFLQTARAQSGEPMSAPTLRSETRVVQIDVAVKDSRGQAVSGLTKQDFTVRDEGKPRAIQIFAINRGEIAEHVAPPAVSQLPPRVFSNRAATVDASSAHTTVILLDAVNDYFDNYARSRAQVVRLIGRLKPDERIAVYVLTQFQGLIMLQTFTTDHELAAKNVGRYVPPGMAPAPVGMEGLRDAIASPPGPVQPRSEKEFFMRNAAESTRSTLQAIANHLAIVPGRKSLLWVTQGFPPRQIRDMGDPWEKTIDAINQANVALDTVDSNGLGGPPRRWGPGGVASLMELSERTGGKAYYNRNDLDAAMAEAIEDQRTSYTLGFYLGDQERDGKYHRLEVHVNRPHLELHYRQGYFAGGDRNVDRAQRKEELESALLSPLDSAGVGITVEVDVTPGSPRGTLRIRTNLDQRTISLRPKGDGWDGKFDQMLVEMNSSGKTVVKISDSRQFHLTMQTKERFEREGLSYSQTIPLDDAAVMLHFVIRDSESGRAGSVTVPLKQP